MATIKPVILDHSQLGGLENDNHIQYALLAGRSGGQLIIGGTGSGQDLFLSSTNHAVKGQIYFGVNSSTPAFIDEYTGIISGIGSGISGILTSGIVGLDSLLSTFTTHISNVSNPHSVTKSQVGLGNVLDVVQEPAITGGTSGQYWRGDKSFQILSLDALSDVAISSAVTSNILYHNGTQFINASPDTAGLVDKGSIQTVGGAKTFSADQTLGSTGSDSYKLKFTSSSGTETMRVRTISGSSGWVWTAGGTDSMFLGPTGTLTISGLSISGISFSSGSITIPGTSAQLILDRGSSGVSRVLHRTSTVDDWYVGTRTGAADYHIFSAVGSNAAVSVLRGTNRVGINTEAPLGMLDVFAGSILLSGNSSTPTHRERAALDVAAIDNTDATRKYRLTLSAYDTAAREGLRIDANGTAARVGIGGAVDSSAILNINGDVRATGGLTLGTSLAVTSGGNGLATAALGDLRYGSAANTLSALAGNTTSTLNVLTQTGTGTASAAPAWLTPTNAGLAALAVANVYTGGVVQRVDGSGGAWSLKPGATRIYGYGANDSTGCHQFTRDDHSASLQFIVNTADAVVTHSSSSGVLNLRTSVSGGLVLTPANGGGSGTVQIGRRLSDSNVACGASVECWPTSTQTSPVLSTVKPGGSGYRFYVDPTGDLYFKSESSTTSSRERAAVTTTAIDNTDASRKYRLTLFAYDTASREGIRIDASGTAAKIGFLGASAVVRQNVSAAATDATTTQTLVNDLRTALINLGLCV